MLGRQSNGRCVSDMRLPEGNYSLRAKECDKGRGARAARTNKTRR
jgi:hypothetical protein